MTAAADVVPDVMPTDVYHQPGPDGSKLYATELLPACPDCGSPYVPIAGPDGAMSTSHGACLPDPARPWPPRGRARRVRRPKLDLAEVERAANIIWQVAQANEVNFTAAVWRIPMDRAGVPADVRRHAIVRAIRAGWIEALDLVDEDHRDLEQYDRRETRWRSHVYVPLRRRRPTTNS